MLSEQLYPHLVEIDRACHGRMELLTRQMAVQEGVTEALKAANQMEWMARTKEARMLEAQIVGGLFNLRCNLQQVETADDPGNPVVAACILRANYFKSSYLGVLKRRPP